ncbi:MAG: N-6 DNA methylase, partial [Syntrophales bacterium]|nr:N-6 DNA methylase [Syntrophales bacterium]
PDENIRKIANAFIKGEDAEKFVKVISTAEAAENDFNLSPSRFVDVNEGEIFRPIPEIMEELNVLEKKAENVNADLQTIFKKLNFRKEMEMG